MLRIATYMMQQQFQQQNLDDVQVRSLVFIRCAGPALTP